MPGLIGTGRQGYLAQAEDLSSAAGKLERDRTQENNAIRQADINQKANLTATGAMVGAYAGGPWGALIGMGVGYLAGSVF